MAGYVPFLQSIQTGRGSHCASYSMGAGPFFFRW